MDAGDNNGKVEAREAAALGRELSQSNKMHASEAQECLQKLEEGQWLGKSIDGYYAVGIRCELQRMYTTRPAQPAAVVAD